MARAPVWRAEFERDLARGNDVAARTENLYDPIVQTRVMMHAAKEALRAGNLQENIGVDGWNALLRRWEAKNAETGKPRAMGVIGATAAHTALPIVKVPANVVLEASQYLFGPVIGPARAGKAYYDGLDDLKPVERESIIRMLAKGAVFSALLAYAFYKRDQVKFGGIWQPNSKKKRGDEPFLGINVGGRELPRALNAIPIIAAMQLAASVGHAFEVRTAKDEDPTGVSQAALAAVLGIANMAPFGGSMTSGANLLGSQPGKLTDALEGAAASRLVPGMIQWIATKTDPDSTEKRYPHGWKQQGEMTIPGLRENVSHSRHPYIQP
jgi:hypothetical protein